MKRRFTQLVSAAALAALSSQACAQGESKKTAITPTASPWLAVPMVSSNPKIGTSAGGMASYLFKLDPESTSSMVGVGGTFSTTDSYGAGVFLRTFWDQDRKRLTLFGGGAPSIMTMKIFWARVIPHKLRISSMCCS